MRTTNDNFTFSTEIPFGSLIDTHESMSEKEGTQGCLDQGISETPEQFLGSERDGETTQMKISKVANLVQCDSESPAILSSLPDDIWIYIFQLLREREGWGDSWHLQTLVFSGEK